MIGRAIMLATAGVALALGSADAQHTTQGPSQSPQPPAQPLDFQGWSTFNGWRGRLDAPAVSLPATYTYNGKQYVVFTAGGNHLLVPGKLSDQVIAFALPS